MTVILCLACSSSLPPKFTEPIFTTRCCSRPICPTCISANPRLARYDPCLACLGGVGVVGAATASTSTVKQPSRNVDGAVRDEDTFVLGGEDSDEGEQGEDGLSPPSEVVQSSPATATPADELSPTSPSPGASQPPSKYYIKRGDTLQGIALRFSVDVSPAHLLPFLLELTPSRVAFSADSTPSRRAPSRQRPTFLHTRSSLTLPPSARAKLQPGDAPSTEDRNREVRIARERAGKRLQTLTKETDWRVAHAYIALADDPDEAAQYALKQKELGTAASAPLEARAVGQYLDDLEWEAEELRAGRTPSHRPPSDFKPKGDYNWQDKCWLVVAIHAPS
ncbi:hypothetical protein C8R46DRAFT_402839 [Mycena filopes]|nr:hypothetical protein C8R46DRAFT_402839 [Mycena filopes]